METFVNDTIRLTLDTGVDISSYASYQVRYRKPDLTYGCWDASAHPTLDEHIYYDTLSGDLDTAGVWHVQAILRAVGVKRTGVWATFDVHPEVPCTAA
jgi:hypothetical protein